MESRQEVRRLLFVHVDIRDPTRTTRRRTRSKSLDYMVRRHLMVDIGKSRRKPPKAPQFVALEWSLAESFRSGAPSSADQGEHSTSQDVDPPASELVVPETVADSTTLSATTAPIIHVLSIFEKEWGEDRFSAYGFALIMVAGRNALCSDSSKGYTTQVHLRFQLSPLLLLTVYTAKHSLLHKYLLVPIRFQTIRLPSSLPADLHFARRPYSAVPQIRTGTTITVVGALFTGHSVRGVQNIEFRCS